MVHTKKIIRDTFWELLEEKPYNKITVQDIVDRCGVNRNTFYYHFQDIPTLMTDSIEGWMDEVISQYGMTGSPVDCLTYIGQEFMQRRKAFLHVFRYVQKEVFLSKMSKIIYDVIQRYVDGIEEYRQISQNEKETLIRCYKCVFVGSLLDWLEEGASYDLPEFYEALCKTFAGSRERALFGCQNEKTVTK